MQPSLPGHRARRARRPQGSPGRIATSERAFSACFPPIPPIRISDVFSERPGVRVAFRCSACIIPETARCVALLLSFMGLNSRPPRAAGRFGTLPARPESGSGRRQGCRQGRRRQSRRRRRQGRRRQSRRRQSRRRQSRRRQSRRRQSRRRQSRRRQSCRRRRQGRRGYLRGTWRWRAGATSGEPGDADGARPSPTTPARAPTRTLPATPESGSGRRQGCRQGRRRQSRRRQSRRRQSRRRRRPGSSSPEPSSSSPGSSGLPPGNLAMASRGYLRGTWRYADGARPSPTTPAPSAHANAAGNAGVGVGSSPEPSSPEPSSSSPGSSGLPPGNLAMASRGYLRGTWRYADGARPSPTTPARAPTRTLPATPESGSGRRQSRRR